MKFILTYLIDFFIQNYQISVGGGVYRITKKTLSARERAIKAFKYQSTLRCKLLNLFKKKQSLHVYDETMPFANCPSFNTPIKRSN